MNQSKASDQFAFYQSKSIKGYQYEMAKDKLELDLMLLGAKAPKEAVAEYDKKIAEYGKKVAKYESEKADIMKVARASRPPGTTPRGTARPSDMP
jgi:hypothetical protein